jgi:hypothetical protein
MGGTPAALRVSPLDTQLDSNVVHWDTPVMQRSRRDISVPARPRCIQLHWFQQHVQPCNARLHEGSMTKTSATEPDMKCDCSMQSSGLQCSRDYFGLLKRTQASHLWCTSSNKETASVSLPHITLLVHVARRGRR